MSWTEHGFDNEEDSEDARVRRPNYASRHPPLVQPLQLSPFSERTREKYGATDLAHEWVALFLTISGGNHERSATTRSLKRAMKMNVPDTIFLSPTGQPSVWYTTCASKQVKARHLAHVTPQSIFCSLQPKLRQQHRACAILYKGFETQILDVAQLQKLTSRMNHACIRDSPKRDRQKDSACGAESNAGEGTNDSSETECTRQERCDEAFCVQQYIVRAQGVSFLCLWRQHSGKSVAHAKRSETQTTSDPKATTVKATADLFLVRRNDDSDEQRDHVDVMPREDSMTLQKLDLGDGDDNPTLRVLYEVGFDADAVVPLLLHVKLLTSEIVSRTNRLCDSSRQVQSLACEFFLTPENAPSTQAGVDYSVYFSSLAGIQWQGDVASWERLRDVDPVSRSINDFIATNPTALASPRRKRLDDESCNPAASPRGLESNIALSLFDELNPRFPSVQSPFVAEKQWKHKTPLLPPHVSPRYVDAEIPKVYRDGHFQPMLSPRQCHSVNRLNATTRAFADAPRHALSKKHGHVEQELWARQDEERVQKGLLPRSPIKIGSLKPPSRALMSPRSPRHRHSLIKEELV